MEHDALITRLQAAVRSKHGVPPPVSTTELEAIEATLGFPLNPLLRRIYLEVANGELFGLFGIRTPTAALDEDSSLLDVRKRLFEPEADSAILGRAVPIVDLGCAQWIWVDVDGALLSLVGGELYRPQVTLADWLEASLTGLGFEVLFAPGPSRYGRNPFTGATTEFKTTIPRGEKITQRDDTD